MQHPCYAFACVVENGGYGKTVAAVICREVLKKPPTTKAGKKVYLHPY